MTKTILVVDDKASVRQLVKEYLSEQGLRVIIAENGQRALHAARHEKPDLILLDIMMPEMDGFEFIQTYRRDHDTPIILLTARLEETDKVIGLELGADDYVTKPFGMRELLARIRAVLRRTEKEPASSARLRVGEIILDRDTHQVTASGNLVHLTPTEFELLGALLSAPGRVFTRAELLEEIQDSPAVEGMERSVDVHIRNLRAKIEPDPKHPTAIETVFGVGYRLNPDPGSRSP